MNDEKANTFLKKLGENVAMFLDQEILKIVLNHKTVETVKKKQPDLTPEEKWDRLNNPTCVEDYGLFISQSELMQFSEGRKFLEEYGLYKK